MRKASTSTALQGLQPIKGWRDAVEACAQDPNINQTGAYTEGLADVKAAVEEEDSVWLTRAAPELFRLSQYLLARISEKQITEEEEVYTSWSVLREKIITGWCSIPPENSRTPGDIAPVEEVPRLAMGRLPSPVVLKGYTKTALIPCEPHHIRLPRPQVPARACRSPISCSVARHQFGSTAEGCAVFLCSQDLAGALAVCRRYSGLQRRDLAEPCAAGCRPNTPSGHATSRHRSREWLLPQTRDVA